MIKIRLMGMEKEVQQVVELMKETYKVLSVSASYKNRGDNEYVRVYVDAEVKR